MTVLLTCVFAAAGLLLLWLRGLNRTARAIVDGAAALGFLILFVLSAKSVLLTLLHGTVYLTEVHGFLRKPLFLLSGAYLGPYVFALIAGTAWSAGKQAARHS
ncbi:hypothetical protein [Paenibacillus humicola]|uniref:hypothetical protein n=1 Tax=Paenibacillus humicola TaxID=3110540 RepID=UPI00237B7297|nr:hypothetical protein [Paenibacillus humicola]